MKKLLSFIVMFLPWNIKRFLLIKFWKYKIHKSAYIGLSYIYPKHLIMEKGAYIGHLNVASGLSRIGSKFYYREKQLDYRFSLKNKKYAFRT